MISRVISPPMTMPPTGMQANTLHACSAVRFGSDAPSRSARRPLEHISDDEFIRRINQEYPSTIETQSKRDSYLLVPDGTPVFFLHGTFNTSQTLKPMVDWVLRDIKTSHPVYVSYVPEIDKAWGIEHANKKHKAPAAFEMVLRDLGDFRTQVVRQNLLKLTRFLENTKSLPDTERQRELGRYFHITPALQSALVPIVEQHLIQPLLKTPQRFTTFPEKNLGAYLDKNLGKVITEIDKWHPDYRIPPNPANPIIDTGYFRQQLELENHPVNLNPDAYSTDSEVINLRPINTEDIVNVERYLMAVEEQLNEALTLYFSSALSSLIRQGQVSQTELQNLSQQTTKKLIYHVAPRILAMGHSQGGTVLLASLIKHLQSTPNTFDALKDKSPSELKAITARSLGLSLLVSAPVTGIPEEPVWGKKLLDEISLVESKIPVIKKRPGTIGSLIRKQVWRYFGKGRPGVIEMKKGSALTENIKQAIPLLEKTDFTVASAAEKADMFIEPEASLMHDANGKHPSNVFNLLLEASQLAPSKETPGELVESALSIFGPVGRLIGSKLPKRIQNYVYQSYLQNFVSMEQHHALVALPDFVEKELGKQLIANPANQSEVLKTNNFEPLRYQSLVARGKSMRKHVLSKPLNEAAENLHLFIQQYPMFLNRLIQNAEENTPITNSASSEAKTLLSETLDLMGMMLKNKKTRKKYKNSIYNGLEAMAKSKIILWDIKSPADTIPQRAQALLQKHY